MAPFMEGGALVNHSLPAEAARALAEQDAVWLSDLTGPPERRAHAAEALQRTRGSEKAFELFAVRGRRTARATARSPARRSRS